MIRLRSTKRAETTVLVASTRVERARSAESEICTILVSSAKAPSVRVAGVMVWRPVVSLYL